MLLCDIAINEIISRHEVLRTCFIQQDGQPIQHILDPQPLPLPVIEISQLDDATREAEANRLAQEEAQRPFDLITGPLIRVILIRMTEDEHILMVTMHHIVSDGWSISVFVRELSALYKAFQFSEPYPLTDLPIQYADFAVWQTEDLRTGTLDNHLSFWKQQLSDIPAMLGLPTDRPRPVVQSFRGARWSFALFSRSHDKAEAVQPVRRRNAAHDVVSCFQRAAISLQRSERHSRRHPCC